MLAVFELVTLVDVNAVESSYQSLGAPFVVQFLRTRAHTV